MTASNQSHQDAQGEATLGGALALRRTDIGHLAPGARADAIVLEAATPADLVHRPGVPLVAEAVSDGRPA